jgi:C4-dicarboxylate-binding protein DctP
MKKLFVFTLVVSLFCLGAIFTQAGAEPVTMRFSASMPAHNFMTKQCAEWAQLVEKNSDGELKVQVFDSAQLYKDPELAKAIATGAVESGILGSPFLGTQLVPTLRVFQMPYLFSTVDEMIKVYKSKVGDNWKKVAAGKGVMITGLLVHPSPEDQLIATTKPVKVPADIKGMTIRVVGPDDSALMKKYGAAPSFIPGMDVYPALQRGTLNGAIGSVALQVDLKRYEVAPYAIFLPIGGAQAYYGINKEFFDKLTPKQQKAILDAGVAMEKKTKKMTMDALAEAMIKLKANMKGIYTPTAKELAVWKEGVAELWAEQVKGNKDLEDALKETRAILKK